MAENPELGATVATCGYATNVVTWGDTEREPVVLLVHGSGPGSTAHGAWAWLVPSLRDAGFAVIAPDLAGFGWTERVDGFAYSLDAWSDQLAAVLDGLGIGAAHVVGNSLGGAIALSFAVREPARVTRLAVMGTVGAPQPLTDALALIWGYEPSLAAMDEMTRAMPYDASIVTDELVRARYEATLRPGWQESYRAMFPMPLEGVVEAMTLDPADVARIDAPVLLLHGREDPVIPAAGSWALAQAIPGAELRVFPRLGHWPSAECPGAYADELTRFLTAPGRPE